MRPVLVASALGLLACNTRARIEPVRRCETVLAAPLADVKPLDVVRACQDVLVKPCRDALARTEAGQATAAGLATADACAAAYCPTLRGKDGQALCGATPPRDAAGAREGFQTLVGEAVAATFPAERARVLAFALATDVFPQRPIDLRFRLAPTALEVEGAGGRWSLPLAPTEAELAPVLTALQATAPDPGAVFVRAVGDHGHAAADALLGAIGRAGYEEVLCEADLQNCR